MVDHYKSCGSTPETPAGTAFCQWLVENTSTEFMEANVNLAVSCIQGQNIDGYLGNTGIDTWTGKLRSYSPHLNTDDVSVELEYAVTSSDKPGIEDFLRITVIPDEQFSE